MPSSSEHLGWAARRGKGEERGHSAGEQVEKLRGGRRTGSRKAEVGGVLGRGKWKSPEPEGALEG